MTTRLCSENQTVVIEDLNVNGMMRNGKLSRALSDMGFHEFRRQLEYKSVIYGSRVMVADRWFPSSKVCNNCGCIKEKLNLSERIFKCEDCGMEIDRDHNAALNLYTLGFRGIQACGQESSGLIKLSSETVLNEAGTKQEELLCSSIF